MTVLNPRLLAELRAALAHREEPLTAELTRQQGSATAPISPQRLRASPAARYDFLYPRQQEHGAGRLPSL